MFGIIVKSFQRRLGGASMNRVVHARYPIRLQHTTSQTPSSAVPPSAQSGRGMGTLSGLLILNLYFLLNLKSYELKMVEYDLNMLKWQLGKGYRPEQPEKTTAISIKEKIPRIFTGHS